MKTTGLLLILLGLFLHGTDARERTSFNKEWKFARFGAMPDGSEKAEPAGMEQAAFNDADWRTLNTPHDWGIEGPFRADLPNRTGKLPWAGIGWYRKSFTSPASDAGKKIFIDIDGSMSGTSVYLNGEHIGDWPYGYASFRFELTDHIKVGEENVLAVRLNNKPNSSRWYPGGGIYRNVWLVKTAPTHVAHWGTYITTPAVSKETATVVIKTTIDGETEGVEVKHDILIDGTDTIVASATGADASIEVPSPLLWDLETPNLYQMKTILTKDGKEIDSYQTQFGIRDIEYNAEGFFLNGKKVKMNGVCQHHDLGPLGAVLNVRAKERQIEILKEFGVNAIRTAHNPPAPEFMDLCDRMGILVQVEAFDVWQLKKIDNDYSSIFDDWHEKDLKAMVHRDRNHPSCVMWSTGNEMIELRNPEGAALSQKLREMINAEDPTRPSTFGNSRPEASTNGFQHTADVFGFNYKPHLYAEFREANPDLPLYGSETASTISSRGEYFFPVLDDKFKGNGGYFQVSSYDLYAPNWAYKADIEFEAQDKYPWVFGEFVWTGFDYIGEPTPYNKDKTNLLNFTDPAERARMKAELERLGGDIPPRSSYFGIVDLCGFKKDRFYLYQAKWRPNLPMAHILPHWNWEERVGKITPVHVYTTGDEAELFLNGKSLGRQKKGTFEYRLRWDDVIYEPGELMVVAYKNGKEWVKESVQTTGKAAKLQLTVDRNRIKADTQDLAFITVDVVDTQGRLVPRTHNSVKYTVEGTGEIVAIGNGDPTNLESFQALERKVFNGKALVMVRGFDGKQGTVTITAEAEGLEPAEIVITTRKAL